jgi:hypothetical protein
MMDPPHSLTKHTYSLKMIERQVITHTCREREKDDDEILTRFLSFFLFYIVQATVTDRVCIC